MLVMGNNWTTIIDKLSETNCSIMYKLTLSLLFPFAIRRPIRCPYKQTYFVIQLCTPLGGAAITEKEQTDNLMRSPDQALPLGWPTQPA